MTTQYSFPSDIWSFGLILAECACRKFPWEVSKDVFAYSKQLEALEINYTQYSKKFNDLIKDCLVYDASKRLTAQELLEKYFSDFKKDKCDAIVQMLKKMAEILLQQQKRLSLGKRKESFVTIFRSDSTNELH